ncbi:MULTISPECIES: DUF262 domain-containing protein [Pseudomonas]|uniref:DUF262 domain-containing protein n=1 Tax=Pseudomonas putida TaxID=303 RepID=A0A7V8EAU8_PSEPU|nr:DUF262 domain-containing protein [Pseudomonas putida]EKT4504769.1 DUF262 domain-containing protein [Pseudomonas putida]KAF0251376.1 DUF262 domain-containing protein [Pseudomonas putida]MDF3874758.1 DUF262 domain-containing protein [Pseudomonas putida]MDF3877205.1 DUF262 domain-containing protein [Pseudomonas putida]
MEARNRTLPDWLTKIRTRQVVLPRFQRYEAWSNYQIESLLNTVLKELPAGAVLTLDVGEKEPFLSRPIATAPHSGDKIIEHLLDGQQRLTAFWRSLNDTYEDRTYLIKIEPEEDLELPYFATSITRYTKNNERYPLWANSPAELWSRKYVPAALLRPDTEAENNFKSWAKDASRGDTDVLLDLIETGNRLRNKFSIFNIPFLSLPTTTRPEVALDVFIKMNTSSSPLSPFDIVVAQIEAASGKSLHGYIEELKQEAPSILRYNSPEDIVLAVAALLSSRLPSKGTYLLPDFSSEFDSHWPTIKHGIKKALSFLTDEKLLDSRRLPTDVVIYVLAALWGIAEEGLDKEGETRSVLRRYIWRAFFTDRYDRTTNSRAFSDYRELAKMIKGEDAHPEIFDINLYPLATIEELKSANWPYRKDRLARAILAISLKSGGFDFADGAPASFDSIQTREYHHVFPHAWLKELGIKEHEINRALNCALISWKTNRNISAKMPSAYVAERMEASSLGQPEIARRLESHLIPVAQLIANDYDGFIHTRAELIRKILCRLCDGEIVEGIL